MASSKMQTVDYAMGKIRAGLELRSELATR